MKKKRGSHFIREWRLYRDMSQDELAEQLGATKGTISRIENGHLPYTQDFLEACADVLGTDVVSLIARDPNESDAIWSIWERAKPAIRRQIIDVAKALTPKRTDD